jgi:hypothetical protein
MKNESGFDAAFPAAKNEPGATRFPVRVWLISFLGWMFDFYDLVLFSFLWQPRPGYGSFRKPGREIWLRFLLRLPWGLDAVGVYFIGQGSKRDSQRFCSDYPSSVSVVHGLLDNRRFVFAYHLSQTRSFVFSGL